MFNFFTSLGAKTNFERLRLNLTTKTLDAQNEKEMNGNCRYIKHEEMIKIFNGEDSQTRSQIAYATIINKIYSSNSKTSWIYLLKNLIIIDRVASQKIFNEEFAGEFLQTIEQYKEENSKFYYFNSERVLKSYWNLIRYECKVMSQDTHIFYYQRNQRQKFILTLKVGNILKQITSLQSFFDLIFELVGILSKSPNPNEITSDDSFRKRSQLLSSSLISQLYLRILQKIMMYYSCQLICGTSILKFMMNPNNFNQISFQQLQKFKKNVTRFKQSSDEAIKFIESHKQIKGFQEINYKQLNPFQNHDILRLIEDYIKEKKNLDEQKPIQKLVLQQQVPLTVNIAPNSHMSKVLAPRIKLIKQKQKQNEWSNAFTSWVNEYSSQFPQAQVLTVDLIQLLKKEEQQQKNQDPLVYNLLIQSCLFSPRSTANLADSQSNCVIKYNTQKVQKKSKIIFQNIYYGDESTWNDS